MGDQRALEEQIASGRDVVAGFIPEIGKAQQGEMKREQYGKEERKGQGCRISATLIELSEQSSVPARRLPYAGLV
jgi:hypothetical protein